MATVDNFLKDIIANPQDDSIRLIFADWLEENGQSERAEFIRVQIELARLGECQRDFSSGLSCYCHFCNGGGLPLRRRERELLMRNTGWAWFPGADFAALSHDGKVCIGCASVTVGQSGRWVVHCEFRRGFVTKITCTLTDWCGERCPLCYGEGGEYVHDEEAQEYNEMIGRHPMIPPALRQVCSVCSGSGRIAAYGKELVKAAPLERASLDDREPQETLGAGNRISFWWNEVEEQALMGRSHFLPKVLFDYLHAGELQMLENGSRQRRYASKEEAQEDLSCACLSWARSWRLVY